MSIFKESADENLVQARHIIDNQQFSDESVPKNCLVLNDSYPEVTFVKNIIEDEFFKKLIIIPERFLKLFLKAKEKYRENELSEGEEILFEIRYLNKSYTLKTFSTKNSQLPIKKRTKILVMKESFPPIVNNEITRQLVGLFNLKHLSKVIAISTSNQVKKLKYFNAKSDVKLSNCEFVSNYSANLMSYLHNDMDLNLRYLILPSEGPATLPKISISEITDMCDHLKKLFDIDDTKFQSWKQHVIKMWRIMDGEVVNSLYL
ncbi:hypothetical protein QEN19_003273 [Hanseniaspora menglaensis]